MNNTDTIGIAVIGLSARFAGAANLSQFWQMLQTGKSAVVSFNDAELLAAGVAPNLLQHNNYVKAGTVLPGVEYFDANFFEMSGRDAELSDPQHRLLMESAWSALEQAGYPPTTTDLCIGLYAGVGENDYQRHYLDPQRTELLESVGEYRLTTLNSKDFVATRIAYKLNLTGPAMTVQTACSTSLVAVHMACQSLLNFECDMALAGGVSIVLPQGQGYLYEPGMILSPDGYCRAFDAQGQGTTLGSGGGMVLLKRLADALEDGDTINGVILGSAVNNDGADKIGYTAPSVRGQTAVILEAQAVADVHPDRISYLEAHGTGTPLGDPIELQALTAAFRQQTQNTGYCAIGSVKTNLGHTDTAAGIAGLIKTVLALKHRQIPASLHFKTPNPQIDFANSPFFVNDRLRDWQVEAGSQRCAGVSAFGIGGTNAHVIVAEAPVVELDSPARPVQLLTLSAKTATALDTATENLANWLQDPANAAYSLPDIAYTLNRGRQSFAYRQILVASDRQTALSQLRAGKLSRYQASDKARDVVFLFPGQGAQYLNMTRGLYETEPIFKAVIDRCATFLLPQIEQDLRDLLYIDRGAEDVSQQAAALNQTRLTQPVLFTVEYALAKLWMTWGIKPKALLGHSIGEYVAACLAGVFALEDALMLVALRGRLMQALPSGAMLAVSCSETQVQEWLNTDISLAVVNGVERCVLSGSHQAIASLAQTLKTQNIECRQLRTSHAFHSPAMEPILRAFAQQVEAVPRQTPNLPYLSNVTGSWITPEQAISPQYWADQLRHTVRFQDNLQALYQQALPPQGADVFLEVGPGHALSTLAKQHPDYSTNITILSSLPRRRETTTQAELQQMLSTLGEAWAAGVAVDWDGFYVGSQRHRLPLPTYPFEGQKYWIERPGTISQSISEPDSQTAAPPLTPKQVHKTVGRSLSRLEQDIAQIWTQCLGIHDLEPDTDFFTVGGDSLLATRLTARLREKFQVALDTHSLLEAPTLAQLASLISAQLVAPKEQTPVQKLVVKIQTGNPTRKPLILMHPVGGHVYFYRELARYLDPQFPVYGIRARGVEGEAEPLTNMAEMAEVYTAALQEFQPQGPYYLAGSSFGGTLAYGMAQALINQGETVAFLGLIDTPSLGNMPTDLDDTADILFYLLKVGEGVEIDYQWLHSLDEEQRLLFYLEHSQSAFASIEELKTMLGLFRANLRAMRNYTPPSYPGKIHFFLARDRDQFNAQTPAHGWIDLAQQGIEIYTVPGNHITMSETPHVESLADRLRECLLRSGL